MEEEKEKVEETTTEEATTETNEVEVDEEPTEEKVEEVKEPEVEQEDEETVSAEEYHEMKKSRNHIIYALLLIIIAFGVYITYNEFIKNKKEPNKPEVKEEKKAEPKEETKEETKEPESNVVETSVQKDLTKKLHTLFGVSGDEIKNDKLFISYSNIFPWSNFFNNKLTDQDKVLIILMNSKFKELDNGGEDQGYDEYLSKDDFVTNFKSVFGINPQSYNINFNNCPSYKYDQAKGLYYLTYRCGTMQILGNMFYIDEVVANDNNATIKCYVGGVYSDEEIQDAVYATPNISYNDAKTKVKLYDKETFIDKDNKTKFSKYNIIFTKHADGKYYYSKIEKAS